MIDKFVFKKALRQCLFWCFVCPSFCMYPKKMLNSIYVLPSHTVFCLLALVDTTNMYEMLTNYY